MYAKRLLVGAALAVVGLLGFTGSANATTVNVTGIVTVCSPTCGSFDFLAVGSEVNGTLDFGAGFDDGSWTGGDVVDLSFTVFNPANPPSPSNPTLLDPTPAGSGLIVANGQEICTPTDPTPPCHGPPTVITSAGTQDGTEIDAGLMDLWLTTGLLANNGAVIRLDFTNGTFNVGVFQGVISVASGTFTTEIAPVPVPAAVWLLGSALFGLLGLRRRA